jgi:hypothetical protein
MHINIQCLKNKCNELILFLRDNNNIDIITVNEHWLKPDELAYTHIDNFFIASSYCRPHTKHGGVLILVTKSWPVTAPGSQGVFRGRGRGFGFLKNGRQAAIVLSWLLLVQLPGQVLRSYSSKVSKSKRFLIVKQILVYSVTAKLSTEQYLVVRYWFTRMR